MNFKAIFKHSLVVATSSVLIACGGGGGGGGGVTEPVMATNSTPEANAGADIIALAGQVITLNGSDSSDADSDSLSYTWTQTSGSDLTVVEGDTTSASFKVYVDNALAGETFEFSLVVNDGTENSSADTVSITAGACDTQDGRVYTDCLDSTWGELGAWDSAQGDLYTDGTSNHVQWSQAYSGDVERGSVVSVSFRDGVVTSTDPSAVWGSFHAKKADFGPEDLSTFVGGSVVFDINVINTGDDSPTLAVAFNCAAPTADGEPRCRGGQIPLNSYGFQNGQLNTWQTVSVPVSDLLKVKPIEGNFDISDVGTAFTIATLFDGASQAGLNFQLDNIRWESDCHDGAGDVFLDCADQTWGQLGAWSNELNDFDTNSSDNHVRWSILTGGANINDSQGKIIDVQFVDDFWGTFYVIKPDFLPEDMSSFASGHIVFDMKLVNAGDAMPNIWLSLNCAEGRCNGDYVNLTGSEFTAVVGTWQQVTVPVASLLTAGVTLEDIGTGFHISTDWNVSQKNVNIQLDNIRWEE